MADGLNMVQLIGHLGADGELRYTQAGQGVLNLRMATTQSYLDKDKVRQERTDWHNVVVFGKRGEALAKILAKGSHIYVQGALRTSSYDDRDGNKRYKTEVICEEVLLLGGRSGAAQGDGGDHAPAPRDNPRASAPAGRGGSAPRPAPAAAASPADDYDGGGYGGGGDDDIPF